MTDAVGAVAVNVTADVTSLQLNLAKGAKATADFGAKAGKLGGAMSSLKGNARGLAQQLNQVAQQTAASGNFMQALAIQLPDMAGMFGAVGAAVGAVAGLVLPTLINALSESGGASKAATEAIDALGKATSTYLTAAKDAAQPTADLAAQYGVLTAQAAAALDAKRAVAFQEAMDAVNAATQKVIASMALVGESFGVGATVTKVAELADEAGLAEDQIANLNAALNNLMNARGIEAQASAAAALQRQLLAAYGSVEKMPGPIAKAYGLLADLVVEASKVSTEARKVAMAFDAAAAAGAGIKSAVSGLESMIGAAASQAWNLAGGLWDAAKARVAAEKAVTDMSAANQRGSMVYSGRGGDPRDFVVPTPAAANTFSGSAYTPTGGGGGGGGTDDAAERLKAMQDQFASEAELQMQEYERQLSDLAEFRAKKLLTEQEYNDLEAQATREHQQAMSDLQTQALGDRLSGYSSALGDLAGLMDSGNKRLFNVGKAAAIAQAVVDGYQSAVSAWKHGMTAGGPGLAAAFAAASLAKTGALISSLRSANSNGSGGGGGGGGSRGGGGTGAAGAAASSTANVPNVYLNWSGGLESLGALTSKLNDEYKAGYRLNFVRA
jgi:hypothetical protein